MGIRSALSKLSGRKRRKPTLDQAEEEYSAGRQSDAASLFRTLAEQGSAQARLRLAQMYERGEGVLQNFVESVRLFRAAAEQGSVPAMARLGEIYLIGRSPAQTATPAALERLEKDENNESLLRRLYPEGLAVAANPEEAAVWNRKAAETGDAPAQARLGYQYAIGLGVEHDLQTAEQWFTAAAKQENPAGQLGLGVLFAGGYGGEQSDHPRAKQWLEFSDRKSVV